MIDYITLYNESIQRKIQPEFCTLYEDIEEFKEGE